MDLLHTSVTRFTRKLLLHLLPNRVPHDPHAQRGPYFWSFSHFCTLVVPSSLRPSHRDRRVPAKGADRGT